MDSEVAVPNPILFEMESTFLTWFLSSHHRVMLLCFKKKKKADHQQNNWVNVDSVQMPSGR